MGYGNGVMEKGGLTSVVSSWTWNLCHSPDGERWHQQGAIPEPLSLGVYIKRSHFCIFFGLF